MHGAEHCPDWASIPDCKTLRPLPRSGTNISLGSPGGETIPEEYAEVSPARPYSYYNESTSNYDITPNGLSTIFLRSSCPQSSSSKDMLPGGYVRLSFRMP